MNQIKPLVNSIANQPAKPLAKLTDQELEMRLRDLATKERKILHVILEHIKEFESRKLYLARAYTSVFEYLVKELGYSNSAAMRRLEAARLLREVPIVAEKIKEGSINLSQIGELSRALKEKEKITGAKVCREIKAELVSSISGKSTKETQKELAVALDIPVYDFEKQKIQQDDSLRIEITLNKAQLEKLQQCKNLTSHLLMQNFNGDSSWATLFEVLADQYLNKRKMNRKSSLAGAEKESLELKKASLGAKAASLEPETQANRIEMGGANSSNLTSIEMKDSHFSEIVFSACISSDISSGSIGGSSIGGSTIGGNPKYDSTSPISTPIADAAIHNRIYKNVTPLLRRTVLLRDGCCQFLDSLTGKRCGSKFSLEVDHKTSQWAGGKHMLANLHTLCREHNSYKYSLESGVRTLS